MFNSNSIFVKNQQQQQQTATASSNNTSILGSNDKLQQSIYNRRLSTKLIVQNSKDSKSNLLHESVRIKSNQVTDKFRENELRIRKNQKETLQMQKRLINLKDYENDSDS